MAPSTIQVCPLDAAQSTPVKQQGSLDDSTRPRRGRKGPPEPKQEVPPESFAEDYWLSPTTGRIPSLSQLQLLLAQGGKAKECLAAQAVSHKRGFQEVLASSKDRWLRRLKMGFNLLFEGVGSKWRLLEAFAQELQKSDLDVCSMDAFDAHASLPGFLRQLLAQLGQHRGIGSLDALVAAVREARKDVPLVLVVHNLEALPPQHQSALSVLVASCSVWLVASVDHLWTQLSWSSDMLKDFNFCREEVHTMESYEMELKGRYPENLPNWTDPFTVEVSSKVSMGLVLKSLTNNHRELVEVMAKNQLEGRKEGISMPDLLVVAEDRMIANNLTKLRRLLNELTDHDIVVQRQGHDGTTVYFLVAKEPLLRRLAEGEMPCADDAQDDDDEEGSDMELDAE